MRKDSWVTLYTIGFTEGEDFIPYEENGVSKVYIHGYRRMFSSLLIFSPLCRSKIYGRIQSTSIINMF